MLLPVARVFLGQRAMRMAFGASYRGRSVQELGFAILRDFPCLVCSGLERLVSERGHTASKHVEKALQ